MSNIIRAYKGIKEMCKGKTLEVIAMVGGEHGKVVAFKVDDSEFVALSERQVIDLVLTLLKRLGFKHRYLATDTSEFEKEKRYVLPDGTVIVEEGEE